MKKNNKKASKNREKKLLKRKKEQKIKKKEVKKAKNVKKADEYNLEKLLNESFGTLSRSVLDFKISNNIETIDSTVKLWNYCVLREAELWDKEFDHESKNELLKTYDKASLNNIFYNKVNHFKEDSRLIEDYTYTKSPEDLDLAYKIDQKIIFSMMDQSAEREKKYEDLIIRIEDFEELKDDEINFLNELYLRNLDYPEYYITLADALFNHSKDVKKAVYLYKEALILNKEDIFPQIKLFLVYLNDESDIKTTIKQYLTIENHIKEYNTKENMERYLAFKKGYDEGIQPMLEESLSEDNLNYNEVLKDLSASSDL